VLPYFMRAEGNARGADAWHGADGPLAVCDAAHDNPLFDAFVEAGRQAGYPVNADFNGAEQEGFGRYQFTIRRARRWSAATAYLRPALSRPNLTVATDAPTRRIDIERGRAIGVTWRRHGRSCAARAVREVILAAGAVASPQILMLSGIGDEPTLREAGIPVTVDAPVGMHCVDDPEWVMPTTWATSPGRPVLEAVLHTEFDVEIRPYTGGFIAMVGDGTGGRPDWPHVGIALMQPRSRGRVRVVSADPRVGPRIEHRYDSEPEDVADLRRGSELARELCPMAEPPPEPLWSTSQHLCATAPMGRDSDELAVLDPQCRVRGVDGLWVIDGAALPAITSRGPHATIVMLAHRAAEFVTAG
jgi:predicted dehydrogenase (TIGR03970 family)